jgi:hypothetical protein
MSRLTPAKPCIHVHHHIISTSEYKMKEKASHNKKFEFCLCFLSIQVGAQLTNFHILVFFCFVLHDWMLGFIQIMTIMCIFLAILLC